MSDKEQPYGPVNAIDYRQLVAQVERYLGLVCRDWGTAIEPETLAAAFHRMIAGHSLGAAGAHAFPLGVLAEHLELALSHVHGLERAAIVHAQQATDWKARCEGLEGQLVALNERWDAYRATAEKAWTEEHNRAEAAEAKVARVRSYLDGALASANANPCEPHEGVVVPADQALRVELGKPGRCLPLILQREEEKHAAAEQDYVAWKIAHPGAAERWEAEGKGVVEWRVERERKPSPSPEPEAEVVYKLVTYFDRPPVPSNEFDWSAVTDDYEEGHPIGQGPTEGDAIQNLLEQLQDNAPVGTTVKLRRFKCNGEELLPAWQFEYGGGEPVAVEPPAVVHSSKEGPGWAEGYASCFADGQGTGEVHGRQE